IAKSYARIGWQNLVNFGIAPLEFENPVDYEMIEEGDRLRVENIREQVRSGSRITVKNRTKGTEFRTTHTMSERQVEAMLDGGVINNFRKRKNS
ncbi:MAG: aconitate hydratase, partial [Balneolales bacterium]